MHTVYEQGSLKGEDLCEYWVAILEPFIQTPLLTDPTRDSEKKNVREMFTSDP